MLSQLKEFFKPQNLFGSVIIPLLAFLVLGYIQRHYQDWWSKVHNSGYERVVEIGGYLLIYILLYVMIAPIFWLRPQLKAKIYKEGSSQLQPETSQIFDLAHRELASVAVNIEFEFTSKYISRKLIQRMNRTSKEKVGVKLQWNPSKLFECRCRYPGDAGFCTILDNGVYLFPFAKMDLEDSAPNAQYLFRFFLGTVEMRQRAKLKAKHLNWKSRLLFGLSCETEFLFEIKDTRPQSFPPSLK
jgi:hypothetical protein